MAKMKCYRIFRAGSTEIGRVMATCITKAAGKFIATLDKPAEYEIDSTAQATVRYADNRHVMADYVIYEA